MDQWSQCADLEIYFRDVLKWEDFSFVSASSFFAHDKNNMIVLADLDVNTILRRLKTYFKVECDFKEKRFWNFGERIQNSQQDVVRSSKSYIFAYAGGLNPDDRHLGKSFKDAVDEKLPFTNLKEYLLVTGFQRWKHGRWMDDERGGFTITSSQSDSCPLCCHFSHHYNKLIIMPTTRGGCDGSAGPREVSNVREMFA